MKIAVAGVPGAWSTETLADSLERRTDFRFVFSLEDLVWDSRKQSLFAKGQDLGSMDGIAVKKAGKSYSPLLHDRLDLLGTLEAKGVRVFSRAPHISRLLNRLSCTTGLIGAGIPMPPTVATEDVERAIDHVEEWSEAVFKPLYSTKARGMEVIPFTDRKAVSEKLAALKEEFGMLYLQQKLEMPEEDYGLVFLGGTYLGAYARIKGEGAWNTTTVAGGKYGRADVSEEAINVATRAQAVFDMDMTTVDVVEMPWGPMVFEVSAFGGFKGMKEGCGIDLAEMYAGYMVDTLLESK